MPTFDIVQIAIGNQKKLDIKLFVIMAIYNSA
jgi:hypothetical protein